MIIRLLLRSVLISLIVGFVLSSFFALWLYSINTEVGALFYIWTNSSWWELMLIVSLAAFIPVLIVVWLVSLSKK